MARTEQALKEVFLSLKVVAIKLSLHLNETKTEYMQIGGEKTDGYLVIGPYKFEQLNSFIYLGSELNQLSE